MLLQWPSQSSDLSFVEVLQKLTNRVTDKGGYTATRSLIAFVFMSLDFVSLLISNESGSTL